MKDIQEVNQAKQDVQEIYDYLVETVRDVTREITEPLDSIVSELSKGINLFSNTDLWDFQVRLGIEAYRLGNFKEQGALKQLCAEALYKEGLAKSFLLTNGAQETKKQQSILDTVDKQAVSMVYATVASLLKTKCDEAHRLVNIIQSIQISRAAEAKLVSSPRSESDRLQLNEGGF